MIQRILVRTPQELQAGWKLKASNYESGYMFLVVVLVRIEMLFDCSLSLENELLLSRDIPRKQTVILYKEPVNNDYYRDNGRKTIYFIFDTFELQQWVRLTQRL